MLADQLDYVIGVDPHRDAELIVDALEMAIARRRPQPGLVHHSDQGSQYVSLRFGERCREIGIHQSMAEPRHQ